jgi:hypothetical protein
MDHGVCDICGTAIASRSAFVNTGPTDRDDPDKPKTRSWVAADTEIHGWTPFVLTHPVCFADREGWRRSLLWSRRATGACSGTCGTEARCR